MTQRILITGGAGFIGTRLVKALLQSMPDARIWVLDNLHPQVHGPDAKAPIFPAGVAFLRGDVKDAATVRNAVAQSTPTLVYHLAAETGTGQSYDEVSRYCDVNVGGTAHLIEAMRTEAGAYVQRVVLAASRAVYGEGGYADADGREFVGLPRDAERMSQGNFEVPLPEGARLPARPIPSHAGLPPAPASVYASTKLMQEYLLRQAGEGAKWNATILRFQNVYGPGQSLRNPYTGVLSIFAQQLLSGKNLNIYEDGEIARDFVFVDDVVNALVAAGPRDLPHGTILDIGSGEPVTILQAARVLIDNIGRAPESLSITGAFRVGDIRYAAADIRAAHQLLDWTPKVDVATGLAQLAAWARVEFAAVQPS
ncbi:NAD-dependent epimerase/dehydratase family protein [Cupriavidus campinensis]|uniref:NAD-dependent epimerase/dehydratase family protein n=1 Tax=Cupriavidus campinensis TaxID=151783 RepID=A0AAE9HWF0_9BURK|nr:NAD-dependent epimerase/dehydratase family protein [Cupriavidus campinensis]URF03422.1 NAD-dependent epimerase/dehydratase family protein [Cupriavidus campinensis]